MTELKYIYYIMEIIDLGIGGSQWSQWNHVHVLKIHQKEMFFTITLFDVFIQFRFSALKIYLSMILKIGTICSTTSLASYSVIFLSYIRLLLFYQACIIITNSIHCHFIHLFLSPLSFILQFKLQNSINSDKNDTLKQRLQIE